LVINATAAVWFITVKGRNIKAGINRKRYAFYPFARLNAELKEEVRAFVFQTKHCTPCDNVLLISACSSQLTEV
jgi:hypothetical protein